jgi:hypothetical protein
MTRNGGRDGYLAFLRRRDGEPDLLRHTLSRREELFAALERTPVRSAIPVDREAYLRNMRRRTRIEPGVDARVLWLLATAKANQAERFGVGLAELYGRVPIEGDPVRLHLHLQETYHTRILADVVAIFGLPVHPAPPILASRVIIKLLLTAPEDSLLALTGFAEMAGCTLFRALRDRGGELFADEPAVAARIRLLYDEILADELSHVGFIACRQGRTGRALMRSLYRLLGHRLATQMPELVALFGRDGLRRRFRAPFHLDAMVDEFPQLAYAAATI